MAKFKSVFPELGFYVGDHLYKFYNGEFKTDDPDVIQVLEKLAGVECVDEPSEAAKEEQPAKIELGEEVSKKQPVRKKKGE